MNKAILIILGAAVLLGGAYFAYTSMSQEPETSTAVRQPDDSQQETTNTPENTTPEPKTGQTKSLAQLSKQGAQQCDLTITPDGTSTSYTGKFYTDGAGKFRTEIKSGAQGEIYYLIVANQTFYNWTNQNNQGIKRTVEATTDAQYDAAINEGDVPQNYSFDCKPWSVDASLLSPPSNITFMDMAELQANPFQ